MAELELQDRHGLIIEQEQSRHRVEQKLNFLRLANGNILEEYLAEVLCYRNDLVVAGNQTNYYTSVLIWQGKSLGSVSVPLERIVSFREGLLDKLQREIRSYFPEGSFQSLDILDNRKFPQNMHDLNNFGQVETEDIAC